MAPKHVQPGQLPKARDYNDLVDSAKRNQLTVSGPLNLQRGPGGQALSLRDMPRLAIFEVLTAWQRRTTESVPDDCISCTGRKVWYRGPTSSPANQYDAIGGDREPIIYHPLSFPGDARADLVLSEHGLGIPRFAVGDWMQCRWNDQAGRWEVMEGAETLWRFELTSALAAKASRNTPTIATANLVAFVAGAYEVIDDVEINVACFTDGVNGAIGCRGYAKKLADSSIAAGWEIVGLLTCAIYALEDCRTNPNAEPMPTLYVSNDLADSVGDVVKVAGTCYTVRVAADNELEDCQEPICVVIEATYEECSKCKSCWLLTECVLEGEPEEIITNTDLAEYEGQVIKISDSLDSCWVVSHYGLCPAEPTSVNVIGHYSDVCSECVCYKIYRCGQGVFRVVTNDLYRAAIAAGELTEEDEISDLTDPTGNGIVFQIDGECWYVDSTEECTGAEEVAIEAVYPACSECGCVKLTECDNPSNVIYASNAVDIDSDPINLRDYIGQVVRLDDGLCYQVTLPTSSECDEPEEVTVLEAYSACAGCGDVYTLHECGSGDPGTLVTTYTDLEGMGYTIGRVIRATPLGGETKCYEIVDKEAVYAGSVPVVVAAEYPDCDACGGNYRYNLVHDCYSEHCEEGDPKPDKVTDEDLSAAVGQWIRVNGICRLVETIAPETEVSSGYEAPLLYVGPFPTCEACQENVTERRPRVTGITADADTMEYVIEREEVVIEDGQIVAICPLEDARVSLPYIVTGTLSGACAKDGSASMTPDGGGGSITVWGKVIRTGYQIPSGTWVACGWSHQLERYEILNGDQCLEEVV